MEDRKHPSEEFRQEVARLGQDLYESRIRGLVEADHIGRYIAIHVDTGDYVVARTTAEATRTLLKTHPRDGRIFLRRIGDEPEYELAARILAGEAKKR